MSREDLISKLQRNELYPFVVQVFRHLHPNDRFHFNWHIDAMCQQLVAAHRGERKNVVITVPPRHLKSITVAVAFVAWVMGQEPSKKIMVASYGDDLARKHGGDCLNVMQSDWYSRLFPRTVVSRATATDIQTTMFGGRKAVSLGGPATGFGADILIIDDLMKANDANSPAEREKAKICVDQTLFSRLDDKQNGAVIAIQQRLHEDDIAAYLLDKGFHHLNLPAIAVKDETIELCRGRKHHRKRNDVLFPAREPLAALRESEKRMGDYAFSAQYQQNPIAPGGNRIRWSSISTYDVAPERNDLLAVVQSWDLASSENSTADWSVCATFGLTKQNTWLLLDVDRMRVQYPALKERVLYLRQKWGAEAVLIEAVAIGRALHQELVLACRHRLIDLPPNMFWGIVPKLHKEVRFDAQTAKFVEGRIQFPTQAPWLDTLRTELLGFPHAKHDDQVDALSQFLEWSGEGGTNFVRQAGNGGIGNRPLRIIRPPTRFGRR